MLLASESPKHEAVTIFGDMLCVCLCVCVHWKGAITLCVSRKVLELCVLDKML